MQCVILYQVAVCIPGVRVLHTHTAHEQLYKSDPALYQSTCHETLFAEGLGDCLVNTIEFLGGL